MGILGSGGLSSDDCEWRRGSVLGLVKPLLSHMPLRSFRSEEESVDPPRDLWAGQQERAGFQEGYAAKKMETKRAHAQMFQSPLPGAQGINIIFSRQGQAWGRVGMSLQLGAGGRVQHESDTLGDPDAGAADGQCGLLAGLGGREWSRAPPSLNPKPLSASFQPCRARRLGRKAATVGGGYSEQLVRRHFQPQPPPPSVLGPALWAPSTQGPWIPPAPLPDSGLASPCPGMSAALRQVTVQLGRPRTGGLPALAALLLALAQQGPRPFAPCPVVLGCRGRWVLLPFPASSCISGPPPLGPSCPGSQPLDSFLLSQQ